MNPGQIWSDVLSRIKDEMGRSAFDSWVKPSKAGSLSNGQLIVHAHNNYARDWMEKNLSRLVEPVLTEFIGAPARIKFVYTDDEHACRGDSACSLDAPGETDESVDLECYDASGLSEAEYLLHSRDTVVYGYLKRLIGEIGPKGFWMYVGFRQAHYAAGERSRSGLGSTYRITSRDLIAASIFSRSAWFRIKSGMGSEMAGLIERVEEDSGKPYAYKRYRDENGNQRRKRLPVKYRLSITPRLSRSDSAWLYDHLKSGLNRGISLEQTIKTLVDMDNEELLALLPKPGAYESNSAPEGLLFVYDILIALIGAAELPEHLEKVAESLTRKIMRVFGTIHINHLFMYRIVQALQLSPHQAYLYVALNDETFLNSNRGVFRDEVEHTYAELASMCGMPASSWKNIRAWLEPNRYPSLKRGGNLSALVKLISRADNHESDAQVKCTFKIATDMVEIQMGLTEADSNGTNRKIQVALTADSDGTYRTDSFGTNRMDSNGTDIKSLESPETPKMNLLNHLSRAQRGKGVEDLPESWNLELFFARNKVHPKTRQALSRSNPQALVSWILWAASNPEIQSPLNMALSQMLGDPKSAGAGENFDYFSRMPPRVLWELLNATPTNYIDSVRSDSQNHLPEMRRWLNTICRNGAYCQNLPALRFALFGLKGKGQ